MCIRDRDMCCAVASQVLEDLGPCDVLINGAGGNNPRATTDKEYFELGDLESDTKSFFDLEKSGVEFVFNLNFIGTLIPTQAFAQQMIGREGCNILNLSLIHIWLRLHRRRHPCRLSGRFAGPPGRAGRLAQVHPLHP